jgi:homeobox protein Unc-4
VNFSNNITSLLLYSNRARKRKRLAKAIERQARKLRAKGIAVDLEALKADYIAQHRGHYNSSDSGGEDEDPIDVVGDDTNDETEKSSISRKTSIDCADDEFVVQRNSSKSNPFSIDSLLFNKDS